MIDQQPLFSGNWVGLFVGLFLGYVGVRHGAGSAVLVAVCGAAGYWIAAFRRGDVDVVEGLGRLQQRGRTL